MTLAIDSQGVIHVAASVLDNGQAPSVIYARCAASCDQDASWSSVTLSSQGSVSYVPTIALTQDGRSRVLYVSDSGSEPGYHYIECDSACDSAATSWRDMQLTSSAPIANPTPRPHIPFAVSPGGRAAFIYGDNFNMFALYCKASCGSDVNAWSKVTLGGNYTYPTSTAFSSDQSLQVVAQRGMQNNEYLQFIDCSGDCSVGTSWSTLEGLWTTIGNTIIGKNEIQAELARTGQGGSRIIVYADDPNTATVERVFSYISCDSQCRTLANWTIPVLLPIVPDSADVGFGLALNSSGLPTVAYLGDSASGYLSCTANCTSTSGTWQTVVGLSAADLNLQLPPTVSSTCLSAAWGMYIGPAFALNAQGNPVITVTAQTRGFGGQCGTGSAATRTDTFLVLP